MNAYKAYFDRQGVSPGLHEKLLALGDEPPGKKRSPWLQWGALAACAALILGAGFYATQPRRVVHSMEGHPSTEDQAILPADGNAAPTPGHDAAPAPESYPMPAEDAATDTGAFTLRGDPETADLAFYLMPALNFVDATKSPEAAASIAVPQGSFEVDLTLTDLQKLFWGPDGKPETLNPDTDLPWSLYWGGYTVWMRAMYDGDGALWQLTVHGEREGDTFTLTLSPGRMPPTCLVEPGGADSVEFQGVSVSSRLKEYDRNGDGKDEVICTSEYLTDAYGCRFENMRVPRAEEETDNREAAIWFNTLFVRYALAGDGLYLDHIAQAETIPAWED